MSDGKAGFARRLNEAFDRLEIPPKQHGRFTALARLFSVSPVAARDWCEGNSYPSVDKLLLIVDTLHCGADWLLFGRAPPVSLATQARPVNPTARCPGELAGGDAHLAPDPDSRAAKGTTATAAPVAGQVAAGPVDTTLEWFEVTGDAMVPTLRPGDRVACRRSGCEPLCDGLYALTIEQASPARSDVQALMASPFFRRIARCFDGTLVVRCDNRNYPETPRFVQLDHDALAGIDAPELRLRVLGRLHAYSTVLA